MKINIKRTKSNNNRSNYKKRMHALLFVFGILSILIIPIFTLFLAKNGNPFTTPLSTIGNRPVRRSGSVLHVYFSFIIFSKIFIVIMSLIFSTNFIFSLFPLAIAFFNNIGV